MKFQETVEDIRHKLADYDANDWFFLCFNFYFASVIICVPLFMLSGIVEFGWAYICSQFGYVSHLSGMTEWIVSYYWYAPGILFAVTLIGNILIQGLGPGSESGPKQPRSMNALVLTAVIAGVCGYFVRDVPKWFSGTRHQTVQVQSAPAAGNQVWVNPNSGIYHRPGHKWYGRTSEGFYMSEDEARAKGYRPSRSRN